MSLRCLSRNSVLSQDAGQVEEPGGLEHPLAAFLTSSMHNFLVKNMRERNRVDASRKTSKKVRAGLGILPNSRPDHSI